MPGSQRNCTGVTVGNSLLRIGVHTVKDARFGRLVVKSKGHQGIGVQSQHFDIPFL
jgi:hypothetical protein